MNSELLEIFAHHTTNNKKHGKPLDAEKTYHKYLCEWKDE